MALSTPCGATVNGMALPDVFDLQSRAGGDGRPQPHFARRNLVAARLYWGDGFGAS